MASIELIDTTVRDGNQSLWGATGLTTGMLTEIAPVMDRVGFGAIDFTTSTHMAVAVRYQRENPWERIRLVREAMPNTPLSFLTTGMRFISWEVANAEFMQLAFSLLVRTGIRRFAVMDPMNDTAAMTAMAALARDVGVETIVAALTYTVSPLHDDAYFVARASELTVSGRFDRIYIKDPGGLLTPERARTLLPAVRAAIADKVLELHSHCTIALAPFTYLAGVDVGVRALHVAVKPLANGPSQPSAERTVANLRDLGHSVDVDDRALAEMSEYFVALADAEGLAQGVPLEYDTRYFRHQMPGGMLGTMRRQLSEIKRLHLLPQVLEEVERVRADLGYPIMVTPFSQVVGAQAVMNIVSGKRYEAIPDEVIRYVIGRFGKPAAKVDANLEDRIRSSPRGKELGSEVGMPPLVELRSRFGAALSDEEFVLRATMPPDQVDGMLAAGPAQRRYDPSMKPPMELLRGLAKRRDVDYVSVETKGVRIEFNSSARLQLGAPAMS
jgi:oxaloacetate decarboxylase (Na+ extruding) subunit alpha